MFCLRFYYKDFWSDVPCKFCTWNLIPRFRSKQWHMGRRSLNLSPNWNGSRKWLFATLGELTYTHNFLSGANSWCSGMFQTGKISWNEVETPFPYAWQSQPESICILVALIPDIEFQTHIWANCLDPVALIHLAENLRRTQQQPS